VENFPLAPFRNCPNSTDGEILGYLLNQDIVNSQKYRLGQGHSVVHIYAKDLEGISIPVFKESEQQKIAQILSTWDKAIELKEKLIEEKKEQKKGLMQKLLTGEVRLSGFDGEWEEVRLGEIAKINMGQSPSSDKYNEKGIGLPLIQGNADIKDGVTAPKLFTSEITKQCTPGDIIMSVRAPVGEIAKSIHTCCIGRGVCSIKSENNKYLYYYLIKSRRSWTKYSQGSTFESVNSSDIKAFKIIRPKSLQEQKAIAQVLSTADKEIELLEEELEQLKLQKKGLMQLLLTGIIRVKS
jgi:type I restriction enzyme S subunit